MVVPSWFFKVCRCVMPTAHHSIITTFGGKTILAFRRIVQEKRIDRGFQECGAGMASPGTTCEGPQQGFCRPAPRQGYSLWCLRHHGQQRMGECRDGS